MFHGLPSWRHTPLALAALAACTPLTQAQSNTAVELPRVDIINVTPVPGLGVPKDQIPANVQTGRAADIERRQALDLSNYMNRALGSVHVNDIQNNPFQPDLNFRGFTASPLLGTPQGLSVYLDGVRLNQPFGDVVSWDLIPRAAISSITLMPGSNPLFGLNTLGGAVSVQTKDGLKNPGTAVQALAGTHQRAAVEFESGGSQSSGAHWYVTGNSFHERGWRVDSPTDVSQLFGKFGVKSGDSEVSLSAAVADNKLTGNGLQEQRLLARDDKSVYTRPDQTNNKALLLNLAGTQRINGQLSFTGNAYYRNIKTSTYNGDINDDSLDQSVYQPNAAERAALTRAGYTGFPTSGETAANTPFPTWRCIAQALLRGDPAQKCNGLINRTRTEQKNGGASGQLNWQGRMAGVSHQAVAGAAVDVSRVRFTQGSELGYLNPDRSVTGVGAFGDGVTGGDVDGEPDDTRVSLSSRTRTASVFATDTIALSEQTRLTISGRYNRTTVKTRDAITPGGGTGSLDGNHRFSRFNPAIGLTLSPTKAFTAYAGINQGSRAPSAIELGCADPESPCKLPNSFAGDPPLKQVVATTMEAGVRGTAAGPTSWNVSVFRSDNQDDLLFVSDNTSGFGYFKNFGKTRRQGVELGFSTRVSNLTSNLTLSANYTYLDATYRSAEVVGGAGNSSNDAAAEEGLPGVEGSTRIMPGDRIPLIPRHMLKLSADWQGGSTWSLGADVTGVGGSFARGNENNRHQPDGVYYLGPGRSGGYAVLNLAADYRPVPALKLFAQVSNVFNRRYHTAAQLGATGFDANGNFQARPFPVNAQGDRPLQHSTFYAPGAPRTAWVGLRYEFGD